MSSSDSPTDPPPAPGRERLPKVSRFQKPASLSLEDWQIALRKAYARQQDYEIENIGQHPVFSEFSVHNPKSGGTYRVAIRGDGLGENFCACPDFATNHLGTCKHIEWTLVRLADEHGAETLREPYTPPYSEVHVQYGARRTVRFQPGAECPLELFEASQNYFDDRGVLRESAFGTVDEFLQLGFESDHEFRCYEDTKAFIAEVRDERTRQEVLDNEFPHGASDERFDRLLGGVLYPFQREGVLFAARAGRSLIGDEMGLGKTVQALATAELMAELNGVESVLVICPTSLKHQWAREISRFTEREATVVEGGPERRADLYARGGFYRVTNYDVIHRDLEAIDELSPDLVILDEAQRIKNWETRTAQVVKKIESPYAIVLTGTPLENRLEELVSIVQFIDQHRLGPTYQFLYEHQKRDGSGRIIGYRNLDTIAETLSPILIRRRKREVLDQLPGRLEKQFFVPMTPQQLRLHDEHRETVARIAARWRRQGGRLPEADQRRLLVGLNAMRMVCDSTYLLDQQTDHSYKPDELLTVLEELLEQDDVKIVIFSEWVRMLKLVASRLDGTDWPYALFHGGLKSTDRSELVDRFQHDPNLRLFLSSDAGGVGLNLQAASVVINLDLPWNPARLEQRIGRVHRMGQTNPVQVINFVSEGGIESGMLSTLTFKKSLSDSVLDAGDTELFLEPERLSGFMETVERVTAQIPKKEAIPPKPSIPNRTSDKSVPSLDGADEPGSDPVAELFSKGAGLLTVLAKQLADTERTASGSIGTLNPETVQRVNVALDALTEALKGE